MESRTCRVGIHGRNDEHFTESDYRLIQEAGIETVKMMSFTNISVFERLRAENPDLEIITRLYDSRMSVDGHPSASDFASEMIPRMGALSPFCTKFEVHNEPNHPARYEGWGPYNESAMDFSRWFKKVYDLLKEACPWAKLGFPGMAVPWRDLEWLDICLSAIKKADWLAVHCYWQYENHLSDDWGLRFKAYHEKFPDKAIHITEFGTANGQADPPIPISGDAVALQYVEYYQELFNYPYLGSASAFIASSPDEQWEREGFVWAKRGELLPVVRAVGAMPRPPLVQGKVAETNGTDL